METEQNLFSIEQFDIMDNGSHEIEVKCRNCGKECTYPFMTLIRREEGESCAAYREFCSHSCFIDWLVYMAPKLKELRDTINSRMDKLSDNSQSEGSIESESSTADD